MMELRGGQKFHGMAAAIFLIRSENVGHKKMPLQGMRASDRLPSGMNYHHFLSEGKGKENNRFSQEKRGKFYQNYNISRFSGSKTGNYSPFYPPFYPPLLRSDDGKSPRCSCTGGSKVF